ncbi:hypothetical protein GJ496_009642 [Pomphorhynchus laevis]|nr:hypothetical protein GJ496_009642 [Pomphorhynchus laevis]
MIDWLQINNRIMKSGVSDSKITTTHDSYQQSTSATNECAFDVNIEFAGGCELLFDLLPGQNSISVQIPSKYEKPFTLKKLLQHIRSTMTISKPDQFFDSDGVRPGILVMINDVDWELMSKLNYEVASGDTILFISTLHGG